MYLCVCPSHFIILNLNLKSPITIITYECKMSFKNNTRVSKDHVFFLLSQVFSTCVPIGCMNVQGAQTLTRRPEASSTMGSDQEKTDLWNMNDVVISIIIVIIKSKMNWVIYFNLLQSLCLRDYVNSGVGEFGFRAVWM